MNCQLPIQRGSTVCGRTAPKCGASYHSVWYERRKRWVAMTRAACACQRQCQKPRQDTRRSVKDLPSLYDTSSHAFHTSLTPSSLFLIPFLCFPSAQSIFRSRRAALTIVTHPGEPRKLASSDRIRFPPFDVDSALVALRSPPHNDSR